MNADPVASVRDLAREHRLLPPSQVDHLLDQPDLPRHDLAELCDFLHRRGVLTRYQADRIREGKAAELNFAGYPVADDLGPCPGGTAYRVLHPSLRTPLVLRRLRTDWLAPADNAAAFLLRAQAVAPLAHPHVAHLLDAGAYRDEPFAVLEPTDGADLEALVADIGPMPAPLAAGYARQAAAALQAAHDRLLVHGHVGPRCLVVGPLVPMAKSRPDGSPRMRPAATAKLKLTELGLVPVRPPLAALPADDRPDPADGYLPPERADAADRSPAGDVYGLGAAVYFLLTGQPPHAADRAGDLADRVRADAPPPLAALRPDLPAPLVELVGRMMARDPSARPTAAEAAAGFAAVAAAAPARPADPPKPVAPGPDVELDLPDAPAPATAPAASNGFLLPPPIAGGMWAAPPYQPPPPVMYAPPAELPAPHDAPHDHPDDLTADGDPAPAPRRQGVQSKAWVLWLVAGAGLNLLAFVGWYYLFTRTDPAPAPEPTKPTKAAKQPRRPA